MTARLVPTKLLGLAGTAKIGGARDPMRGRVRIEIEHHDENSFHTPTGFLGCNSAAIALQDSESI